MRTDVDREYEYKVFEKGQLKDFALKFARFCKIEPSKGNIFHSHKVGKFDTSTNLSIDELDNICEIGNTRESVYFFYNYNMLFFSLSSQSTLHASYTIEGDIEYAKKLIFLVENALELRVLKEQDQDDETISESKFLEIDGALFQLMRQDFEKESDITTGETFESYFHKVIKSHCQKRIENDGS